jgi:hypothetical protein
MDARLDFIIIGIQKSATTYLHNCLGNHPEVFMPKVETPCFLENHYDPDLNSLKGHIANSPSNVKVGIKRPDYMVEDGCAERIYKHFPDCKLIAVLRNPIDRAISAYFHLMSIGYFPVMEINKGFMKLLDGKLQQDYPSTSSILEYGVYSKSLYLYKKLFGNDKLLVLLHDDILENALKVVKKCYYFIKVDTNHNPSDVCSQRPRSSIYSYLRQRVLQFVNKQVHDFSPSKDTYWYKNNPTKLNIIFYKYANILDHKLLRFTCTNNKPLLSQEVFIELLRYYENDIHDTEIFLKRDLSRWKQH